jgi:hypothetical protein
LAKFFYGSSPLWLLHHKIDPKKNPDFHPPESITIEFFKGTNLYGKIMPRRARMNQESPVHHEGWMVSGEETVFLLGFSSLANHSG